MSDFGDAPDVVRTDEQAEALRHRQRGARRLDAERRVAEVLFGAHHVGILTGLLTVMVPVTIGAIAMLVVRDFDVTVPLFWALTFAGGGAFWVARRLLAPRVLAAERARLQGLGFELVGWFEPIAEFPPRAGRLRVRLEFRDPAPDAERLAAWLGAVDARQVSPLVFLSPVIHVRAGQRGTSLTTRGYWKWVQRLVFTVLQVIHRAHPLRTVTLSRVLASE